MLKGAQMDNSAMSKEWQSQLFGIQRSIRYHARRQSFYDFWNTFTTATSIIGGAGTVAALLDNSPFSESWRLWFPAIITVVSTLNLVWGTSRAARLHNDLYRRFVDLEREITGMEPTEAALRTLKTKRLEIEADEPPTKFALDVLCHNELVRAMGIDDYREVSLPQRLLAHFLPFPNAKFPRINKPAV
jgi:hypothetical protein